MDRGIFSMFFWNVMFISVHCIVFHASAYYQAVTLTASASYNGFHYFSLFDQTNKTMQRLFDLEKQNNNDVLIFFLSICVFTYMAFASYDEAMRQCSPLNAHFQFPSLATNQYCISMQLHRHALQIPFHTIVKSKNWIGLDWRLVRTFWIVSSFTSIKSAPTRADMIKNNQNIAATWDESD